MEISTKYGDVYWLFWLTAILFYVVWDTVSTYFGISVWNLSESVEFSRYVINEYGFAFFTLLKLAVIILLFFTVHLIPDDVWTLNDMLKYDQEKMKDVYIPLFITLFGVIATINNFLVGLK